MLIKSVKKCRKTKKAQNSVDLVNSVESHLHALPDALTRAVEGIFLFTLVKLALNNNKFIPFVWNQLYRLIESYSCSLSVHAPLLYQFNL